MSKSLGILIPGTPNAGLPLTGDDLVVVEIDLSALVEVRARICAVFHSMTIAITEDRPILLVHTAVRRDVTLKRFELQFLIVEHRALGKAFAAKLIAADLAADDDCADRLRREAEILAKLEHENIVQVHDFGTTNSGHPFILMELLNGETLHAASQRVGAMAPARVMTLGLHMLNGLEALHALGCAHLNLTPKSFFIHRPNSGRVNLKLIEAEHARMLAGVSVNGTKRSTLMGRVVPVDSRPFMSPEAISGLAMDHRSDLYSIAAIMRSMLLASSLRDASPQESCDYDRAEEEWSHVACKSLDASSQVAAPRKSTRLDEIILRGLAQSPDDRFQSAAEFADAVFGALQEFEDLPREGHPSRAASSRVASFGVSPMAQPRHAPQPARSGWPQGVRVTTTQPGDMGAKEFTGPFGIGDVILEQYEVVRLIGAGGHAYVYECLDNFMDAVLAVKVISSVLDRGRDLLDRAHAEARLLFKLNHRNVVRVINARPLGDSMICIVMEKLEGSSLRECLRRLGRLTATEALLILRQIAEGIGAAHRMDVIHRDIKPENVFLLAQCNQVKVLDFGIAKFLAREFETTSHAIHGTPVYMSPEHLQNGPITVRSDVYQLGILAFELMTGRIPCLVDLEYPDFNRVAYSQIVKPTPQLSRFMRDVGPKTEDLVRRATAKEPDKRFENMAQIVAAVDAALLEQQMLFPHELQSVRCFDDSGSPEARLEALPAEHDGGALVSHFEDPVIAATKSIGAHTESESVKENLPPLRGWIAGSSKFGSASLPIIPPSSDQSLGRASLGAGSVGRISGHGSNHHRAVQRGLTAAVVVIGVFATFAMAWREVEWDRFGGSRRSLGESTDPVASLAAQVPPPSAAGHWGHVPPPAQPSDWAATYTPPRPFFSQHRAKIKRSASVTSDHRPKASPELSTTGAANGVVEAPTGPATSAPALVEPRKRAFAFELDMSRASPKAE